MYLPKKTRDRLSFAFKNAENKPKFSGEHTLLIKFRNYLVHYNPEFLPSNDYILEHSRKNLYKTLINKFNHPYGENETFPRRVLCYESSKWAVKTAAETVIALNSAYGINAPYVAVELNSIQKLENP